MGVKGFRRSCRRWWDITSHLIPGRGFGEELTLVWSLVEKGEEEVKRIGDDATEGLFTRSRSRVSNFAS
jgi:hypothetical protein